MVAQVFIDHLTLPVRDFEASKRFYRQALAPFGVEEVEVEVAIGWGPRGARRFLHQARRADRRGAEGRHREAKLAA